MNANCQCPDASEDHTPGACPNQATASYLRDGDWLELCDGCHLTGDLAVADTWTTDELTRDFTVRGFQAPYVVVVRKADDVEGTLMFTHRPRWYFGWAPHVEESKP